MEPANPAEFINTVYRVALVFGGLIAFGAIVYGAALYTMAAGDTEKHSEARDRITQALLGLLLLLGAYLILQTINPSLVLNLNLLDLERIEVPDDTASIPSSTVKCVRYCAPLTGIPNVMCAAGVNCAADSIVATRLKFCMQNAQASKKQAPSIRITEGMPPTVKHDSITHYNGCAIDMTVGASDDCAKVREAINFLQSYCGFRVLNEYPSCGGRVTKNQTGSHLHVEGPSC